MPTELMERFSRKQWKDCCGKGCKKCEIAQAYIGEHGRKKGLELLNEDRAAVKKGKALKKTAKADAGKKAKAEAKAGSGKKGKKAAADKKGKKAAKK
jgi:hypothetical protein